MQSGLRPGYQHVPITPFGEAELFGVGGLIYSFGVEYGFERRAAFLTGLFGGCRLKYGARGGS